MAARTPTPAYKTHVAIINCGAKNLEYITWLLQRTAWNWKAVDLRPYFRDYRPPEYGLRESSDEPRTEKAVYELKSFADAVIATMKDLYKEKTPILVLHCSNPWATAHCVAKTMVQLLNSFREDCGKEHDGRYALYRGKLFSAHEWRTMDLMLQAVGLFI